MAISLPGFTPPPTGGFPQWTPPPLPFDRARAQQPLPEVPNNAPSGSLVIIDQFVDSYQGAAHGNVGAYAARQHGFRGQIYAEPIGPDVPGVRQSTTTLNTLTSQPQDPATSRQAIQDYTRHSQRELLESVTGDLEKIRGRGLQDSAVNVSYGTHPQAQADYLYGQVRSAPQTNPATTATGGGFLSGAGSQGQYQLAQNVFNAYGIDQAKFHSNDPNVSGPERLRLQQSLLSAAEAGLASPDVQTARADYGQAVRDLEANNNSVVVSVGNQGQILDNFARDANGLRVKTTPQSNDNVLVNPDVTTVGATRWYDSGSERIAAYNSQDPQTDIYASGSVGNGVDQNQMHTLGTSYAAPRVAGAMATLHGNYPGMPSANIENLMRNRLTHDLEGEKVLDFQLAEEYMRRGTF